MFLISNLDHFRTVRTDAWEAAPSQPFDIVLYVAETQRMCTERGQDDTIVVTANRPFHKYSNGKLHLNNFRLCQRLSRSYLNSCRQHRQRAHAGCRMRARATRTTTY